MKRTAGKWDPDAWPMYFLASNVLTLQRSFVTRNGSILVAVNELAKSASSDELMKQYDHILLDSGIYWLTTQHALHHEMNMNEALALSPEEIDHWPWLLEHYIATARKYESKLWGYIELDQGGRENKQKTRAMLENLGLRPIPVYHPLNDGWDYFDLLASEYDRICVGNIVRAYGEDRKRILATIWERRRKYPHLWIHALGMTPNDMTLSYMMNSFDSSSWVSALRYSSGMTSTINSAMKELIAGFVYRRDVAIDEEAGHTKAGKLCGYSALMLQKSLQVFRQTMEDELGADMELADVDHG